MRIALLLALCALTLTPSCSFVNMFKGPADFSRNHYANLLQTTIDESIADELARKSPNGWIGEPYSRRNWNRNWNKYWNARIYHLYDLGRDGQDPHYRGPSDPQFISYIISNRRAAGLHPIDIEPEPRNRNRVPR